MTESPSRPSGSCLPNPPYEHHPSHSLHLSIKPAIAHNEDAFKVGQVQGDICSCSEVEHQLEGEGPWGLPDGSEDLEIIFTPGHSEAHCVLFYKPQKVMLRRLHHARRGWQQHGMTATSHGGTV